MFIAWSKGLMAPLPNAWIARFVLSWSPFHGGAERFFMLKCFEPPFAWYQLKKYKITSCRSHDAICSKAISLLQGTCIDFKLFLKRTRKWSERPFRLRDAAENSIIFLITQTYFSKLQDKLIQFASYWSMLAPCCFMCLHVFFCSCVASSPILLQAYFACVLLEVGWLRASFQPTSCTTTSKQRIQIQARWLLLVGSWCFTVAVGWWLVSCRWSLVVVGYLLLAVGCWLVAGWL